MEAQLDPNIGRRTRMAAALFIGMLWCVGPWATGKGLERWPDFPRQHMYWSTTVVLAVGALVARWGKESLMKTQVNRRFISACMIMFAAQFVLEIGANISGLATKAAAVLHILVWFMSLCMASAFIEKKLWPATVAMMIAFFYASAYPDRVWIAMSASNSILLVNFLLAWRRPKEDREYRNQRIREGFEAVQRRLR
jgi:hypothetical protein